ncbi:MAG: copper resistance protein CopC [Chloroflexi bacterium]|nr:copper resistance protein CopC [Chloroflexota bacterium]
MRKIIALIGGALALLALVAITGVPAAYAHAEITSCVPPLNGAVETAPDKLVCKASEALDPKGSSLSVFDATGMQVDKGDSAVDLDDPDRVTISVSLDTGMMKDGAYTVKWKTLSSEDNDEASGEFKFTVGYGAQATVTPEATQAPEPTKSPEPTNAPEPTAAPTADAGAPTTLPATGNDANFAWYGLLALVGALMLGAGVLAERRARR